MKKTFTIILIGIGVLFGIYKIIGLLGFFTVYNNVTTANEPNLKFNSKMIVSNLVEPKNGDFISYTYNSEMFGFGVRTHRLFGMAYDTLEIKNGIVFINSINVDQKLNLIHNYEINKDEFNKLKENDLINENTIGRQLNDKYIIAIEDKVSEQYEIKSKRKIENREIVDNQIYEQYNRKWNKDYFGKLIIPENKYFVIGDNRDNSEDSRQIGLIDKKDIVGVIINK